MGDDKAKLPQFDGHWDHWSEVMENFFRAKGLWKLVENGLDETPDAAVLTPEQRKLKEDAETNDHKVKHYLYQSIDRVTLEQILDRRTSKIIWDSMKSKFAGNARVKRSLLQKLRRDFEVVEMKEAEKIEEYFKRVLAITNQMRSNGEIMTDTKVVEKILRTLSDKFMYVVVSIEESKDIESLTLDELQSSLSVHEQKFKRIEKGDDHVLNVSYGRGVGTRGRGFNGRGRGRCRGRNFIDKSTVECYKCHRLGHFKNECPKWEEEEANYVDVGGNETMLLMVRVDEEELTETKISVTESDEMLTMDSVEEQAETEISEIVLDETAVFSLMGYTGDKITTRNKVWFLDSGCSNHMSGERELFSNLNREFEHSVKLGNDKRMGVMGKGDVTLILNGNSYQISDVFYVPELKNNLLSLGQLQEKKLTIIIQKGICKIFHEERGKRTHS